MALTNVYVDPSIAGNSGTGTIGDPYGDLQYAFDTQSQGGAGDRFNIKAGTDEVLTAALDLTTYTAPGLVQPLVIQGYTSAAQDGGIGGISGNALYAIFDSAAYDYICIQDMHLHNSGSARLLQLDNNIYLMNCELDNSSNAGDTILLGSGCTIKGCHIHNLAGNVYVDSGGLVMNNYFENGTNKFVIALELPGSAISLRNIFHLSGAANTSTAISLGGNCHAINNSIWSDAGSGDGIFILSSSVANSIVNNLIEGFSATGGQAVNFGNSTTSVVEYTGNSEYDNISGFEANPYTDFDVDWGLGTPNETLGASPFTSASTGDFSPVDTGSVKEGSVPDDFAGQ